MRGVLAPLFRIVCCHLRTELYIRMGQQNLNSMFINPVNEAEVIRIIKVCKPKDSMDYNDISMWVLSRIAPQVVKPLVHIFTSHRGTDMAIAVAHDVSQYYNSRGSSTFKCSFDAEGSFDHIPHSVIFGQLDGMMPDHMWRLLYRWYDSMYVTLRLNGSLGRRLDVRRGLRQG